MGRKKGSAVRTLNHPVISWWRVLGICGPQLLIAECIFVLCLTCRVTSLPFFLCAGFDTSQMATVIGRRPGCLVQQLKQNRKTFYSQLREHNQAIALLSNYIYRAHFIPCREGSYGKKYIFIYSVVRYRPLIFY